MEFIRDDSDKRLKDYCVFCGALLATVEASKDHVPSKIFLDKPYPKNLFQICVCKDCNNSFSMDEEYAATVLGVLMSGSADPDKQAWNKVGRILSRKPKLQQQLEKGLRVDERGKFFKFKFDEKRLANVLAKNAKTLAIYMISESCLKEPSNIDWRCISQFNHEEMKQFETIPPQSLYPEVGSRMLYLVAQNDNGWIEIQKGVFRFATTWSDSIIVRMVFREFLFAEVVWNDSHD